VPRRPLAETLVEVVDALAPPPAGGLRVTSVGLELPLELQLRPGPQGPELLGELPRWRWRTVFDERPGRVRVTFRAGGAL
jgi:hypothetical protein